MRLMMLAGLVLAATPAAAFELSLPIACTVGTDCAVQHYFDRDPGDDRRDYMCGHQTYDGHDGVDIRVPDLRAMADGVTVIAAAPGTVRATRDGMTDVSIAETGAEAVQDVECGNGVMIDHDGGWATQYCHLKRGSVLVRSGDRVETGTPIGEVGLSGMTEFPHVHLSVYKDDVEIDPFALEPAGADAACNLAGDAATGVWSAEAKDALAYRPAFVLTAGFADRPMEMGDIESGAVLDMALAPTSPALVFYGRAIGIETGDVQRIVITAPDGSVFSESDVDPVDRPKAQYFAFTGRKLRDDAWPAGTWTGRYSVIRDGEEVAFKDVTFEMPE
jgi:murein DD-endopeptidase MepM/ murein hydrolase activator NlpD